MFMSLNIKNEETHAKVRRLAEFTGASQTAAVDDAVERRLRELGADPNLDRRAEVRAALARFAAAFSDEEAHAVQEAQEALYDPDGLPV